MKKAMKTPQGLKSVMSLLAEEEERNNGFVAALQSSSPSPSSPATPSPSPHAKTSSVEAHFPTTAVKLQAILKNNSK